MTARTLNKGHGRIETQKRRGRYRLGLSVLPRDEQAGDQEALDLARELS